MQELFENNHSTTRSKPSKQEESTAKNLLNTKNEVNHHLNRNRCRYVLHNLEHMKLFFNCVLRQWPKSEKVYRCTGYTPNVYVEFQTISLFLYCW